MSRFERFRIVGQSAFLSLVCLTLLAASARAAEKGDASAEPAKPVVEMKTNVGTIVIELWPDIAPETVENFLSYIKEGFYDGTIFHRIARNPAVIQGGGFTRALERKKPGPPIRLEAKESNRRYTIAMARSQSPHSATCQFYINTQHNTFLDPGRQGPGYAVFGKVIKGAGVVDQIARMKTQNKGGAFATLPMQEIVIENVTIR